MVKPEWFLVVEDPEKPSTYHLQVADESGPNHRLMGSAWAALMSPNGFRGNKYEGPNKDEAIRKLKALYASEKMPLPSANMAEDDAPDDPAPEPAVNVYLKKLKEMARALFGTQESISKEDFDRLIASARGHAGGKAKASRASMNAVFSDEDVTVETDLDVAQFSAGDMVIRTGKLFQIGEYPDKDFSFDESDMAEAIAGFQPCPVNLEHTPTVLDGKLGNVQRIFAGTNGALMGEVHVPQWLDTLLADGERKVSAEWDRATKSLKRLSLVRSPRVSDAALMAAFSAQEGADDLQKPDHTPPRRQRMNFMEWVTGKAKEDGVDLDPSEMEAAFSDDRVKALEAANQAEIAKRDAEIATLKAQQATHAAQFAAAAAEKRHAEAVTFSQNLVSAHKLTPAAAEALVPLAERISALDTTATFADGEKSTQALLAELAGSLTDLSMFTTESINPGQVAALFNVTKTSGVSKDDPPSPERIKELMALLPDGHKIIAEMNGKG